MPKSYIYLGGVNIYININNINIHYKVEGSGEDLILLHGWGANLNTFLNLSKNLSENFRVYSLDLPGFGESKISKSMDIEEVTKIIKEFVDRLKINNPILLCHSYGGRIGIVYSSKYYVRKLVLVSSPGVKEVSFKKRIKIRIYKILKVFRIKLNIGSEDYKNADEIMKEMLVKTVNQDLVEYMKGIDTQTLLMYGDKDNVTPLSMGYKINSFIKGSRVVVLKECGHFPYLERPGYFMFILNCFLLGENNVD